MPDQMADSRFQIPDDGMRVWNPGSGIGQRLRGNQPLDRMRDRPMGLLKASAIRPEDYVGDDEARNEAIVREGFIPKAKRFLRQIPIATEVIAMYYCMLDSKTPLWVKGIVAAALAYFILPVDAIPDIIPIIGMS